MTQLDMLKGFAQMKAEILRLSNENLCLKEKAMSLEDKNGELCELEKANQLLQSSNADMAQEIESMKVIVADLKSTITKFSKASKTLDDIQSLQKPFGDMTGIGFSSQVDVEIKTKPVTTPSNGVGKGVFEIKTEEMQRLVNDSLKRQSKHGLGFKHQEKKVTNGKTTFIPAMVAANVPFAESSNAARKRIEKEKILKQRRTSDGSKQRQQKKPVTHLTKADKERITKKIYSKRIDWEPILKKISPTSLKWQGVPNNLKKSAPKKRYVRKSMTKSTGAKTLPNNGKVHVPYYLKRYDPSLQIVLLPQDIKKKILLPGQRNFWIQRSMLTNLKGSIFVDT